MDLKRIKNKLHRIVFITGKRNIFKNAKISNIFSLGQIMGVYFHFYLKNIHISFLIYGGGGGGYSNFFILLLLFFV